MDNQLQRVLAAYLFDSPSLKELTLYFALTREPGVDRAHVRQLLSIRSRRASEALALAEETRRLNDGAGYDTPEETLEPLARAYLAVLETVAFSYDSILPLITYQSYDQARLFLRQTMNDDTRAPEARAVAKECLDRFAATLTSVR